MAHPGVLKVLLLYGGQALAGALDADAWTPLDLARQDVNRLGPCSRRDEVEAMLTEAPEDPSLLRSLARADAGQYTSCYCEENVLRALAAKPPASPLEFALFISNKARQVAMFSQVAGRGGVAVWDYHVVRLVLLPEYAPLPISACD